uniref:Uncharacterized protein n=1 Tax=Setaria italica TaxID=4555 RepID=K3XLH1_SETIT
MSRCIVLGPAAGPNSAGIGLARARWASGPIVPKMSVQCLEGVKVELKPDGPLTCYISYCHLAQALVAYYTERPHTLVNRASVQLSRACARAHTVVQQSARSMAPRSRAGAGARGPGVGVGVAALLLGAEGPLIHSTPRGVVDLVLHLLDLDGALVLPRPQVRARAVLPAAHRLVRRRRRPADRVRALRSRHPDPRCAQASVCLLATLELTRALLDFRFALSTPYAVELLLTVSLPAAK